MAIESAIKAIEAPAKASAANARATAETLEEQDQREAEAAQAKRTRETETPAPSATTVDPAIFSTRITLDSKTLQVYIQTVAEQPQPQARVVHSYPPPPESADPNRLIVLA